MKNDIVLYANGKAYHCVSGATYTEEFSETLDSMSIVLDNVQSEDRLELEPYMFVRVKNVSEDSGKFAFDEEMLVDDYTETETNISQHIYRYVISLMSETKLLEKWQCPNLTISHSIKSGKKTIYEYLAQYCELYVPKVKMSLDGQTWAYSPIFELDTSDDFKNKFSAPCADMAMQAPTFRQLLTNLMLQSNCIPVVKKRKITYLDFAKKQTYFYLRDDYGFNKVQRSNASDSYVNVLATQNEQLLDSGNEVISETLGFRDGDNVFLQQKSNLKLHTAFPIYNVTQCVMNAPTTISGNVLVKSVNMETSGKWFPYMTLKAYTSDGSVVYSQDQTVAYFELQYTCSESVTVKNARLCYMVAKDNDSAKGFTPVYAEMLDIGTLSVGTHTIRVDMMIATSTDINNYYFYFISDVIRDSDGITSVKQNIRICRIGLVSELYVNKKWDYTYSFGENLTKLVEVAYYKVDMTANVVESSKRQLLDTDFSTMPSVSENPSAEEIAKWVYGTVGYAIGKNEISGFSQTYTRAQGWWSVDKTYIENLSEYLLPSSYVGKIWASKDNFRDVTKSAVSEFMGAYLGEYELNPLSFYSGNFSIFIFDISYQPLNSLTHKAYKKETALPLEQLDATAQGLTDFDRFAQNLQEKTERLGNAVKSVNQTTDNAKTLQSLNAKDDDGNVCFKRTIAINNNYLQVSYYLSKDYVIKNYFTSVATKYRAYEHIDYTQSTLRKEHRSVFVRIESASHKGECDGLKNSATSAISDNGTAYWLKGLLPYNGEESQKIRYVLEQSLDDKGNLATVKFDVSTVVCKNSLSFVYENWFNIGNGTYLKSIEAVDGGIPQAYQIWGDDYKHWRKIAYVNALDMYTTKAESISAIAKEPIVKDEFFNASTNILRLSDYYSTSGFLTQYKDEGERVNQTLQIVYVNATGDNCFDFTEELIRNVPFVNNSQYGKANALVALSGTDLVLKPYPNDVGVLMEDFDIGDFVSISGNSITFKPMLNLPYKIVHAFKDTDGDWKWIDIALFNSTKQKTYYVNLTDTNTQKAFGLDTYGVPRLIYEDDGTGQRKVRSI